MSGGQLNLPRSPSDGGPLGSAPNRTFGILSPPSSGQRHVVQQRDAQSASGSFASPTPSGGLLPAFSTRPYSCLPTPKSPKHTAHRFNNTPDSPLDDSPLSASHPLPRLSHQQSTYLQTLTPDSSPFVQRGTQHVTVSRTGSTNGFGVGTPNDASSGAPVTGLAPPHRITSTIRSRSRSPVHSPRLSPSADNIPLVEKAGYGHTLPPYSSSSSRFAVVDDVFMAGPASAPMGPHPASTMSMSTPPHSHRFVQVPAASTSVPQPFWAQSRVENPSSPRDAESRRPDYLKRARRPIPDTTPAAGTADVGIEDRVGIAMTPVKGRRLKLFQETSEESFEESLMAGGYGRYRTLTWAAHAPTSDSADQSISIPTPDPGVAVSPRDLKKQKRLAAFRESGRSRPIVTKLFPVDIEGKGRLLLNVPGDGRLYSSGAATTKRGPNRRRKKPLAPEFVASDDTNAKGPTFPNWPDSEFPWRLRAQERAEMARAQEEAKLGWIEKFLDRDTDEEDEQAEAEPGSISWNHDNDPSRCQASGKRLHSRRIVPSPKKRRKAAVQNAPADARNLLLSKRSLQGTPRKQRKGNRRADDNEDEVLCICQGRGDGTLGSVQCDDCLEWFHFQCIGIRSQSELGNEEDPWYCNRCATRSPSPEPAASSEPTLVPTHDEPSRNPRYDPPFFQMQLGDSPMPSWAFSKQTRTPTRSGVDEEVSPTSSYMPGPSTPQWRDTSCDVRVFSTPGTLEPLTGEEHPFDPTSTPSRGISIPGSFMTPKSRFWTFIPPYAAQAISKSRGASSQRLYGQSSHDDGGAYIFPSNSQLGGLPLYDDTALGRAQYDSSRSALVQKTLGSPVSSRVSGAMQLLLPVSPIVRSREGPREGDANRRRE